MHFIAMQFLAVGDFPLFQDSNQTRKEWEMQAKTEKEIILLWIAVSFPQKKVRL